MIRNVSLEDIKIRTHFKHGDLGYLTYLHGILYWQEFGFDMHFESYVAKGLHEFFEGFNQDREGIWVAEYENRMVGFILLTDAGGDAQLRYFLVHPDFRGIGLGRKLLDLYMGFMRDKGYKKSFLLTKSVLTKAAGLYRRNGFTLIGEEKHGSIERPLLMQRYELRL